jgi:hypothetical protein
MNLGMAKLALESALALLLAVVACSVTPSRAPLGGNYSLVDPATPRDRRASPDDSAKRKPLEPAAAAPVATSPVQTTVVDAGATTALASSADTLHYDPLKTGDQIKADVSVTFKAAMESGGQGILPGDGTIGIETKFRIDLKVVRASTQALDELELILTPLSLTTEFGGRRSVTPQEAAKTFDITLSGHSPSVRERGGDKLTTEERAVLIVLVSPLSEFHGRWARSPNLELEAGYRANVPLSVPSFMSTSSDTMHIGPFTASYTGRDANSDQVPFQIALPAEYGTAIGKLELELTGVARLSANRARPVSIDLSGPVGGGGGPHGELSFHGSAKFAATLSYP